MELPQVCHVADVITTWQMLQPRVEWLADVIANVADVIATGHVYFNLSSVMLFRTSSHI